MDSDSSDNIEAVVMMDMMPQDSEEEFSGSSEVRECPKILSILC